MYHELYIDVFFFLNFMMDYLLLLFVKRILKCSATHGNICIGSLIGSLCTSVIVAIPGLHAGVKIILFHGVISFIMLRKGLHLRKKELLHGLICLYIGGFLLGGILTFFQQYIRIGSLFFFVAIVSYQILCWIWSYLWEIKKLNSYYCNVKIILETGECVLKAIIDTGNSLRDPLTDYPICIVEKRKVEKWLNECCLSELRTVPFHSIGKKDGQLPVIQVKKMCVYREKEYWFQNPIIGICEENISTTGRYHMILNPDIF